MRIISPVLPSTPDIKEVDFAKNQPEYLTMPAAVVDYTDGSVGVYESRNPQRIVDVFRSTFMQ